MQSLNIMLDEEDLDSLEAAFEEGAVEWKKNPEAALQSRMSLLSGLIAGLAMKKREQGELTEDQWRCVTNKHIGWFNENIGCLPGNYTYPLIEEPEPLTL